MLNKINKYKFILIFSLFVLFLLFSNKVNATSIEFEYGGKKYNTVLPNEEATNYVVFVASNNNIYLSFTKSLYLGTTNKADFVQCYQFAETSWGSYREGIRYKDNSNNNLEEFRYRLDGSNWVYNAAGWDGLIGSSITVKSILFSNCDVYNNSCNTVIHESDVSVSSSFHLEYNENLKSYVVYSEWYGITDSELYAHQHYYQINPNSEPTFFNKDTYDFDGWLNMEGSDNEIGPGAEFNEENEKEDMDVDKVRWRVGLKIIDYGTYYFVHYLPLSDNKDYEIVKFVITEDGEAYTETFNKNSSSWSNKQNITDISSIRENIFDFNMYVIYDNYSAIIYSNYFKYDDRYNYDVSMSYDGLNYSTYLLTETYGHIPDEKAGYYRFYKEVTENRTYYFRLRVFDPETGGSLIDTKYTNIVVNGNFYLGSTVDDVSSYRKSGVYKVLKNKLGILFYPIDITFEFFERLSNVEFSEPSISVPTVREYFTGAVIINGFTFNLNSVLQNDIINNVYNIYLMFVDFIIYVLIFGFLYKVFKEFFNIGGLFNG